MKLGIPFSFNFGAHNKVFLIFLIKKALLNYTLVSIKLSRDLITRMRPGKTNNEIKNSGLILSGKKRINFIAIIISNYIFKNI